MGVSNRELRRCSRCQGDYDPDEFSDLTRVNPETGEPNKHTMCRDCYNLYRRERRAREAGVDLSLPTFAEIGRKLGMSTSHVVMTYKRAMTKLRMTVPHELILELVEPVITHTTYYRPRYGLTHPGIRPSELGLTPTPPKPWHVWYKRTGKMNKGA